MRNLLLGMVTAILLTTACTNNNEEDLYGCKPEKAVYSTLKPVFDNNCIACHNTQFANRNIRLDTYENVKTVAQTGRLVKVIKHETGVAPMPQGGQKLADCEIQSIESWIQRNMPEN